MIAINGQFPGPIVHVTTNNNLVVNVLNNLDEPLLFTWRVHFNDSSILIKSSSGIHYIWVCRDDDSCLCNGRNGIQQRRNSWQDGVLGTNCPIPPRWNWTYQFQLKDQIGSFFYFPSLNFQRVAGGYGGIVLHNRLVIPVPFDKPDGDITLLIGDWYNRNHTVSVLALFPGFEHCKVKCLDFLFRYFLRASLHLERISIWRILKFMDIVCFSISERAFVLECFQSVVLFSFFYFYGWRAHQSLWFLVVKENSYFYSVVTQTCPWVLMN